MNKKAWKRKAKKLARELAEREEMYITLQDDYIGYTELYYDLAKLLIRFSAEMMEQAINDEIARTELVNDTDAELDDRVEAALADEVIYVHTKGANDLVQVYGICYDISPTD